MKKSALLLGLFLVFVWSSTGNAEGYLKLGMWPRHNEDILDVHGGINKYRLELSQKFRFKLLEVEINPKVMAGGDWPKHTKDWGYNWVYLENNIIFRVFMTDEVSFFYHKKRYHGLWEREGVRECNCTYANEVGLQLDW